MREREQKEKRRIERGVRASAGPYARRQQKREWLGTVEEVRLGNGGFPQTAVAPSRELYIHVYCTRSSGRLGGRGRKSRWDYSRMEATGYSHQFPLRIFWLAWRVIPSFECMQCPR